MRRGRRRGRRGWRGWRGWWTEVKGLDGQLGAVLPIDVVLPPPGHLDDRLEGGVVALRGEFLFAGDDAGKSIRGLLRLAEPFVDQSHLVLERQLPGETRIKLAEEL